MPYKSKETAWVFFVLSILAFWFKGGLVFIGLLWAMFFLIILPHDLKELKKYNKYLERQNKPKQNNLVYKKERRNNEEEKILQRNKEIDAELKRVVDNMNVGFKSK